MSALLRVLAGSRMKPKPVAPGNTQQYACGEGRRGLITQARPVIWNVDTQAWEVGAWTYQSDNCVTVPKPATSETRYDCPTGYSGYRVYGRAVTWNAATETWTVGGWGVTQDYCSYVPPPTNTQVISCPAGYIGAGQVQQRSVTWNATTQSWVVGGWTTVQFNCIIASFRAVGPTVKWPGGVYDHIASANGFNIRIRAVYASNTISYEVWCPELAGRSARPAWEKYEYHNGNGDPGFRVLDASGYASYAAVTTGKHNIKSNEYGMCFVDIQ